MRLRRAQWCLLIITLASTGLVVLFPPWLLEIDTPQGVVTESYCCFDRTVWARREALGQHYSLDWSRWLLQIGALVVVGSAAIGLLPKLLRQPSHPSGD